MMALVLSVIADSRRDAFMFIVDSSISTKTGLAPTSAIISAVEIQVYGTVITSSPGPIPKANNAISKVSVPLDAPTQCFTPT